MKLKFERPVFIGAHPDDNCIGCGGIISRLRGTEFHFYTFSCLNNKRKQEWIRLTNHIKPTTHEIFLHKGNMLPDRRYEIRQELEKIKETVNPDIVFTHTPNNTHQSHIALAEEVERIMRDVTILGYPGVKNVPRFVPSIFFEISEEELEEKAKLISFIESESWKPHLQLETIKAIARVNGVKSGVKYAEAFDVSRIVINNG